MTLVTVNEAAQLAEVSVSAMRKWIARGWVRKFKQGTGRVYLDMDEVRKVKEMREAITAA